MIKGIDKEELDCIMDEEIRVYLPGESFKGFYARLSPCFLFVASINGVPIGAYHYSPVDLDASAQALQRSVDAALSKLLCKIDQAGHDEEQVTIIPVGGVDSSKNTLDYLKALSHRSPDDVDYDELDPKIVIAEDWVHLAGDEGSIEFTMFSNGDWMLDLEDAYPEPVLPTKRPRPRA